MMNNQLFPSAKETAEKVVSSNFVDKLINAELYGKMLLSSFLWKAENIAT